MRHLHWLRWVALALAAVVLLLGASQWRLARALVANWRVEAGFTPLRDAPRVRYAPGGQALARVLASYLEPAIAEVEQAEGKPFPEPVAVYVCGTLNCFERYTAQPRAGGTTLLGHLFISPRLQEQPWRIPSLLAHELSHLHLSQTAGPLRLGTLPPWFSEGLAVADSNGGGAEPVSPLQAAWAIRAGLHFDPASTGWLFTRKTASDFGLPVHLFYRQAGMFVAFLRASNPAAFAKLMHRVRAGSSLAEAFQVAYGTPPAGQWPAFLASLPVGETAAR
ncbi:MAG TPA: hypothetical protein VKB51_19855 [bacterium]|nr:hypothetical protein [bacterium]